MDVLPKPRLRGVFHQYAFYVALVAGVVLVAVSDSGRELIATWIYAVALAAMFGVSALYHRVDWKSTRVRTWMRRLDHSTILLLIAGTYTPFALLAFDGARRRRDPDRRLGRRGRSASCSTSPGWTRPSG